MCYKYPYSFIFIIVIIFQQVFPEGNRDFGICVSTGYFCFFTFLLTKTVPFVVSFGGIVSALGFFIAILLLCTILLYFIMPETKELTSQQIEDEITRGKLYQFLSAFDCNSQDVKRMTI